MSDQLGTSRVFDLARKMKARLEEQTWPSHPAAGTQPHVAFADPDIDAEFELVLIVPSIGDDATIDWIKFPNGRDESVGVEVLIRCYDLNDEDALLDRLEELADVVQRAVYDDTDDASSESSRLNPLGVDGVVQVGGISRVAFDIWPAPREGLFGQCSIRYAHQGRI